MEVVERARTYLHHRPPAVAGQRGSDATFAAAIALTQGFALDEHVALVLLSEWNANCRPPWNNGDLKHKVADAARATSKRPRGWLLDAGHGNPVPSSRNLTPTPPPPPPATVVPFVMPTMHAGTQEQLAAVARLRGLSIEGVTLASDRGLLWFGAKADQDPEGNWIKRPCWYIRDSHGVAGQARRMDGEKWKWIKDGEWQTTKAWTVKASYASWPIGVADIGDHPGVALVEGGPDLLAACHFIAVEGREADCAPVAMLGAGQRIDDAALPLFKDKRVRIYAHVDDEGRSAATRWTRELQAAGATVDCFDFAELTRADGKPVNDLNDFALVSADDFENERSLWRILP